jgi:hypothetical protein
MMNAAIAWVHHPVFKRLEESGYDLTDFGMYQCFDNDHEFAVLMGGKNVHPWKCSDKRHVLL